MRKKMLLYVYECADGKEIPISMKYYIGLNCWQE
jgi:hypothetical protein